MKKYLAIVLALVMLLAFAGCGAKDEDATTTTGETVETPIDDTTAAEETSAAADEETTAAEDETSAEAEDEDPSTWDAAKVIEYYNTARKKTVADGKAPKGHQTMKLAGDISGDGAIGVVLKVLNPAAKSALEKNSKDTDWIPGDNSNDILVTDVKSATAKADGKGNVIVNITLKDQKDGSDGDNHNGGPVARGTGTLGSIDNALKELGAELTSGRDTVSLTYTDAYLKNIVINQNSGYITGGTWHYLVKVFIGNAKAKLGITATLENLKANIDYTVVA